MNAALLAELQPGERLLWSKPGQRQTVQVAYDRPADEGGLIVTLPDGAQRRVSVRNVRRLDARSQ